MLIDKWLEETESYSDSTASSIDFNDLENAVNEIVEQLPPKRQKVFRLSRNEGLSNDEIAKRMNIQKKTVENHLNHALKYLREKLNEKSFLTILFFVLFY
jgi:RNA polymerase sigma-70 factor (ECF subfamily)